MDKRTVIAALDTLRDQLAELKYQAIKGVNAAVGEAPGWANMRGRAAGLADAAELVRDLTGRIEKGWEVEAVSFAPNSYTPQFVAGFTSPRFGTAKLLVTNGKYTLHQLSFNTYPLDASDEAYAITLAKAVVKIRDDLASDEQIQITKPTDQHFSLSYRCGACGNARIDCRCHNR